MKRGREGMPLLLQWLCGDRVASEEKKGGGKMAEGIVVWLVKRGGGDVANEGRKKKERE